MSALSGIKGKFLIASLGACVSLAVIGFEFFFGFTAARLALLFGVVAALISLGGARIEYRFNVVLQSYYALSLMFFLVAFLSYLLVGGQEWAVISWLLMALLGFCVLLSCLALDGDEGDLLFRIVVVGGFVFFGFLLAYCVLVGIIFAPGYYFRIAADEFASVGLNRVVNAMIFFGGVFVVAALDDNDCGLLCKGLAVGGIFFLLYFSFAAGARQGLLGFFIFIVFYLAARFLRGGLTSGFARSIFKIGFVFVLLIPFGLLFSANVGVDGVDWFLGRFQNSFESGGNSSDAERLGALHAAVEFGFQNSGFGVGFGNFKNLYGIEPHNGYAGLFAEVGVYLFVFNLAVLALFGLFYYFALRQVKGLMPTFLMAYLPVHFFFLMNVKDLLREPFTWVLLGMIGFAGVKNGRRPE